MSSTRAVAVSIHATSPGTIGFAPATGCAEPAKRPATLAAINNPRQTHHSGLFLRMIPSNRALLYFLIPYFCIEMTIERGTVMLRERWMLQSRTALKHGSSYRH